MRPSRRAVARRWWWVPGGFVVALATWPVPGLTPTPGLDPSWKIALHLAAQRGLDFPDEIVFTYGPLGFLSIPFEVTKATAAASIAFSLVAWLALALVAVAAAARAFPPAVAGLLAFVALSLPIQIADVVLLALFFAAVHVLDAARPPRAPVLVAGAGVIAGFDLLVKLNSGVIALVVLALAAWRLAPGGIRSELVLFGSAGVTVTVLWLLTGNDVGALPDWFRAAQHVVSGYTETSSIEVPSRWPQYVWAGALLLAGLALLSLHVGAARPTLWLAAAVFAFAFFKQGFVRHDGHDVYFFGGFGIGVLAFAWRSRAARLLAGATVLTAAAAVVATPEIQLRALFHPLANAERAASSARLAVSPQEIERHVDAARAGARAQLALDDATLTHLRGQTVHVAPYETSAVWAYGFSWRPEPILQEYAAYDGYLDAENAEKVAERGPSRILRQQVWPGPDFTHPAQEAPATFLARLCRYREVSVRGPWQVLARVPGRCGRPRRLGTVEGRAGTPVRVPKPPRGDDVVYARVRLPDRVGAKLLNVLFKPLRVPKVVLGSATYRFVSASAENPFVLRLPPTSGLSPYFGGSIDYARFTLLRVPSPFRVEFYAVSLRGERRPAPPAPPPGRLDDDELVIAGTRFPIAVGRVDGFVDVSLDWGRSGAVLGWSLDRESKRAAERVFVFADGKLVAVGSPSLPRPDVAAVFHAPPETRAGFRLLLRLREGASVRVFALSGGQASELGYGAGFTWRHD